MSVVHTSKEKIVSMVKYIGGLFLIAIGFISVVVSASPRTFNSAGVNSEHPNDTGIVHADAPYAEGSYGDSGDSGDSTQCGDSGSGDSGGGC